jgi:hypothetical protein
MTAVPVMFVQGPLAGDGAPASFWSSTPANIWRHNVATGSCARGYWFEFPVYPDGPSFTTEVCPRGGSVIGEFGQHHPQWPPMLLLPSPSLTVSRTRWDLVSKRCNTRLPPPLSLSPSPPPPCPAPQSSSITLPTTTCGWACASTLCGCRTWMRAMLTRAHCPSTCTTSPPGETWARVCSTARWGTSTG